MSKALKLLVVEDSDDDASLVIRVLRREGFEVQYERVESAAAMAAALRRQAWDAVVSDHNMPGFSGLEALRILRSTEPDIPFILISGTAGEEIAVDALKAGAGDYVLKKNLSRLPSVLERELREAAVRAEHRRGQRKLIENEAGLRHAQILARLAHVITEADGTFESWSDSLPALIGVEPAQMPGSTREWLNLIHPEDRELFRTTSIEAGRRGTRMSVEYRIRHEDGAWIHVNQVMEPVDAPADAAGGRRWFNTLQDISRQKHAAEALRASEERHRAMFEQAAVGIVHTSLDGRLLMVNPKFCEMSGYTRAETLQLTTRDLICPEDVEQSLSARSRSLSGTGMSYELEPRLRRKDRSEIWVHVTTSLVRAADGQPSYFISVLDDISERKRAEQEIRDLNASLERRVAERTAELARKNMELEQANRAKSDFLANMSHELRTPMNSIIGFSEMLKDGLLGVLDAKQRGFVSDIFDAGTHLLSLINDILDLSKVEAGMLRLEPDAVDVLALLKASTLVVREKALANHIRLDTRIDPALGIILADERKLKQIVYNLLSNAVKFTPGGGTVTLRARRCTRAEVAVDGTLPGRFIALPQGEAGEFLAITVEDTGVGIAEEHLPKLFEAFVQVDNSVNRRQGGTGLGLSLVRRFAELHGGTVGVASRPGAGSAFSVWLPCRESAHAAQQGGAAPVDAAPSEAAVPLALVIEDDDSMADLINLQLRAEGFKVMRASTAEEGLVRAAKSKPQLITLDIFLPSMDGWEFMRRLRADPRLADTPVVIITVSDDLEHGLALGARRVLQKPFAREDLVRALAGLVAVRRDGEPACVLVVDDNVKAVELVAAVLEAEGYRAIRAYGGAEAIEAVRNARPDLVILDLLMPDMSGFEVARALRESEHTARVPILVLTAKDLTAEDRSRLNGDVSAILGKASFSPSELLAELRRAIALRKTG